MNKYEFRSAYSKIALSEEFKKNAKEKLLSRYDNLQENITDSADVEEQHVSNVIKISPNKERRSWKAAVGIGSAAAVVGLGIWGGIVLMGQDPISPYPNSGTTAESSETSEALTEEVIITDDERFDLVENSVTFPAYYDMLTEYNQEVFSALPFELDISLPDGWHFEEPEEKTSISVLELKDENGDTIGSADFNIYEIYPDMSPELEGYYHMVYNQLMLNSMVNWDSEYTVVKQEGGLCSATCRIITDVPERFDNWTDGYGILAHNDDLCVYVNIAINIEIDDELHAAIARSVDINEDIDGIAGRIADDYLTRWDAIGEQVTTAEQISTYGTELDGRRLIFAANPDYKNSGVITYFLNEGRMYVSDYIIADSVQVYKGKDDILLVYIPKDHVLYSKETDDDVECTEEIFYRISDDGTFDFLSALKRAERDGEITYCDIKNDIDTVAYEITYEQYLTEKVKLLQGYSMTAENIFADFAAHGRDRDIIKKCIRDAFDADDDGKDYQYIPEMTPYTMTTKVYHLDEDGNFISPTDAEKVDIHFSLPLDWEYDYGIANLYGKKIFELGVPYPESEGIDHDSFKESKVSGIVYTVHEEQIGTEDDPFEYYIYRSAPEKYSPDGSYDAYYYVVSSNGYNIAMHFIADAGVDKTVFEQVLRTVNITSDEEQYTGSPIYGVNSDNKRIAEEVSKHFFENYMTQHTWDTGTLKVTSAKTSEGMIIIAEDLDSEGAMTVYSVKDGNLTYLNRYEPYRTEFAIFECEGDTVIRIIDSERLDNSPIARIREEYFKVHYYDGLERIGKMEYDYNEIDMAIEGSIINYKLYEASETPEEITYEQYLDVISSLTEGDTELKCGEASITLHEQDNDEKAFSDAVRYAINETDGVYREPLFILYCDEYRTGFPEYAESWLYEGEEYRNPTWTDREQTLQNLYDYGIDMYMSLPVYEGHTLYAEVDDGGVITAVKSFDADLENEETVTTFTGSSITFPSAEINSRRLYEITVTYPQGTVVGFLGVKHYTEEGYKKQLLGE